MVDMREAHNCFSLELGESPATLTCSHCGKQLLSVCGFISRNRKAYCTYFALLHTGHDKIAVLLTISIGNWWDDDAVNERRWVAVIIRPSETQFNMRIEEPERSHHFNWRPLGTPLSRKEALVSPLRTDFLKVADYIVEHDPAVNSYLNGEELNISRGPYKH